MRFGYQNQGQCDREDGLQVLDQSGIDLFATLHAFAQQGNSQANETAPNHPCGDGTQNFDTEFSTLCGQKCPYDFHVHRSSLAPIPTLMQGPTAGL
jgi:hypothetical protein